MSKKDEDDDWFELPTWFKLLAAGAVWTGTVYIAYRYGIKQGSYKTLQQAGLPSNVTVLDRAA